MSDIELLILTHGIIMLVGIIGLGIHFYIQMKD
jgi:hypothetical protein